jgi:hypothetical protein
MKVYVVMETSWDQGSSIRAIFASEKQAQKYISNKKNTPPTNSDFWLEIESYLVENEE